ncbi:MAG: response regulator [Spirochaetes bacterium]|nr:response regulator [Spirochaetota bacterium]
MSRVLIVEDEKAAIERIVNMKVWRKSGFRICGTASNGKEALAKYKKTHPDIIITDIEMPIMSGLDFLAEVRKRDKRTAVIILSCYESFAYAKKAIQLGVKDYLIKDFLEEDILYSTLLNADNTNKAEDAVKGETIEHFSSSELNLKLFKLLEEDDADILNSFEQKYGSFGMFSLLYIHIDHFDGQASSIKKTAECLVRELESNFVSLISYMGNGYYLVLLCMGKDKNLSSKILETAAAIIHQTEYSCSLSLTIAAGKLFTDVKNLKAEFKNVRNLIKYRTFLGQRRVILPESVENLSFLDPVILEKKISAIRESIIKEDTDNFFYYLKQLYERDMAGMIQYNYIEYVNSNLISILLNFINEKKIKESDSFAGDFLDLYSLRKLETIKDMHAWFRTKFIEVFKLARETEEKLPDNIIVREILSIIRNEYKKDLSVEHIAGRVKIHRVYLNRLFKKETGRTCYKYIQEFRIKKAKQLLITENYKIAEIAEESGFRNYDQFCVVFKKTTGQTPTGFRKENKNI